MMSERPLPQRWAETIAAIQRILIQPDRGAVIVTFRVIPPVSFEHGLLHRTNAYLVLERSRGVRTGNIVPGQLFFIGRNPIVGINRPYQFVPHRPTDLTKIVFGGLNSWSNVAMMTLITPLGRRKIWNRFRHSVRPS